MLDCSLEDYKATEGCLFEKLKYSTNLCIILGLSYNQEIDRLKLYINF